jgi:hypothetical protein
MSGSKAWDCRAIDRRQALIGGGVALAGALAYGYGRRLGKRDVGQVGPAIGAGLRVLDWTFPGGQRVVTLVPEPLAQGEKLPLLIALHGRGETSDPRRGAYGWLESYGLDASIAALRHPPLTPAHFQGFVDPNRMAALNEDLRKRPFGGLVVACPALPPDIGGERYEQMAGFFRDELLPRLRLETPIVGTKETTGIDGVSLGGISALRIGLPHPELFGVIGALQPAIIASPPEGPIVDVILEKLGGRPLRLVTSDDDVYRGAIIATSETLRQKNVGHELLVTPGPHDYVWNKGPGGIEMLLWHDRMLRARA